MLFLSLALKNARKLGKLAKFFLVVREPRKNSEIFPKNVEILFGGRRTEKKLGKMTKKGRQKFRHFPEKM